MGKLRSLTSDEIVVQLYYANQIIRLMDLDLPQIDNIVFMGMVSRMKFELQIFPLYLGPYNILTIMIQNRASRLITLITSYEPQESLSIDNFFNYHNPRSQYPL